MEHRVFELAKRDHRRHLALIERARAEASPAERARAIARLASDWRHHSKAEHTAVLGFLLAEGSARPLARRAVAAHQRLHRAVSDLTGRVHDEVTMAVALSTYRSSFLEYMRFEEEELFPAAMLALGNERSERLAERYLAAVTEGDTHPA